MRGGAQAHLLAADDGGFYVVKFANNPQGRRVLVNEWIAALFLKHLQIATPLVAMIEITPQFLEAEADVFLQLGSRRFPPDIGWHFGSRFPGDPLRLSVFDFVTDDQLRGCANRTDYHGALVFDKWMSNADARQSIFYRAKIRAANSDWETSGLVTQMIDNGFVFDGPNWRFADSPIQGGYPRAAVYGSVAGWHDLEPWLERVRHFPEEVFDEAIRQIPPAWISGEEDEFEKLLERLYRRRDRAADLVDDFRRAKPNLFPHWR